MEALYPCRTQSYLHSPHQLWGARNLLLDTRSFLSWDGGQNIPTTEYKAEIYILVYVNRG